MHTACLMKHHDVQRVDIQVSGQHKLLHIYFTRNSKKQEKKICMSKTNHEFIVETCDVKVGVVIIFVGESAFYCVIYSGMDTFYKEVLSMCIWLSPSLQWKIKGKIAWNASLFSNLSLPITVSSDQREQELKDTQGRWCRDKKRASSCLFHRQPIIFLKTLSSSCLPKTEMHPKHDRQQDKDQKQQEAFVVSNSLSKLTYFKDDLFSLLLSPFKELFKELFKEELKQDQLFNFEILFQLRYTSLFVVSSITVSSRQGLNHFSVISYVLLNHVWL